MNDENDNSLDDQFASWVSAYHDALAGGAAEAFSQHLPPAPDLLPRVQRARACLHLLERVWPRVDASATPVNPPPAPERADSLAPESPAQIDRFQIRRELGRGGFGMVFLAWDPRLGRAVALKVPRRDTLARADLRRRFVWEAQAAAGLSHLHIVPVYEAGEAGAVLYIASEYCPGPTLAEWLERRGQPAPPWSAACLVATLAEAVHYIHSRGILHRDLKPRNILLTAAAGQAPGPEADLEAFVPKVTDFGLAKVLERAGDETKSGALLGTPRYMAPEQVRGRIKEIGWHTDVYALGVILYELLTGRPPFATEEDLDTHDLILSQEATPPSHLAAGVPRDLETICLKCLQKEPGRRYPTAQELAGDLQRFLNGEPIAARPVGRRERLWRWCRRNRAVAGLTATVVIVLLAGSAVSSAFALRSYQKAQAEEEQRHKADLYFQHAVETVDQFCVRVTDNDEIKDYGLHDLRRQLLEEARDFFEQFIRERGEEARLRGLLAQAHFRLALIARLMDPPAKAIRLNQQALSLFEELAREQPAAVEPRFHAAQIHYNLGDLFRATGKPRDAARAYDQGLTLIERLVQENPGVPGQRHVQGQLLAGRGFLCRQIDGKQAVPYLRRAAAIFRELVKQDPAKASFQTALGLIEDNLGCCYRDGGHLEEAQVAFDKAVAIHQKVVARHPRNPLYQYNLAAVYGNRGRFEKEQRHQFLQAEEDFRHARTIQEKLASDQPKVVRYQNNLAKTLGNLAYLYKDTQRPELAKAAFMQARTIQEKLHRDQPDVTDYALNLGVTYGLLAELSRDAVQPRDALAFYDCAIQTFKALCVQHQSQDRAAGFLTEVRSQKAIFLAEIGEYRRAIAIMSELAGKATSQEKVLFDAACVYGLSAAAVAKDEKQSAAEQRQLAEEYAGRAVTFLVRAHKAGFFHDSAKVDALQNAPEFKSLRSRPDFSKFLQEAGAKVEPGSK